MQRHYHQTPKSWLKALRAGRLFSITDLYNNPAPQLFRERRNRVKEAVEYQLSSPDASISYQGKHTSAQHKATNRRIKQAIKENRAYVLKGTSEGIQEADESLRQRTSNIVDLAEASINESAPKVATLAAELGEANIPEILKSANIVLIQVDEEEGCVLDGHAGVSRNTIYIFAYDLSEYTDTEILKLGVHEAVELKAKTLARQQNKAWDVELAKANHRIALQYERAFRAKEAPKITQAQAIARDEVGDETILKRVLRMSEVALTKELANKAPSADVIILTAGTHAMAQAYESIYNNPLRSGKILRKDVPIIAIPDPMTSMGNGAALAYALHYLYTRLPSLSRDTRYKHLEGAGIEDLRIVIIQAGGFGSRLAITLAHGSKPLMKIPKNLNPETSANILDYVIKGSYKFSQALQKQGKTGLIVLNGDGLLINVPHIQDGANLIVYPETKENAANDLGVVLDDQTLDRRITEFKEKPGLQELNELVESPIVFANTASCVYTDTKEKYTQFTHSLLRMAEIIIEAEENHNRGEVDTSNDMLLPASLSNNETELNAHRHRRVAKAAKTEDRESSEYKAVDSFYQKIYNEISLYFPELFATGDVMTTFYRDLGSTSTYIDEITGEGILSRVFGFEKVIHSFVSKKAELLEGAHSILSYIDDYAIIGGSVIYRSCILADSFVGDGSLVYAQGLVNVGDNEVLMQVPVEEDFKIRQAILYFGANDGIKDKIEEGSTIFGVDMRVWCANHGLLDGEGNLIATEGESIHLNGNTLFELPLWPVIEDAEVTMDLVSWMSTSNKRPPKSYFKVKKVSIKEITRNQTSKPRVFEAIMMRDEKLAEAIQKSITSEASQNKDADDPSKPRPGFTPQDVVTEALRIIDSEDIGKYSIFGLEDTIVKQALRYYELANLQDKADRLRQIVKAGHLRAGPMNTAFGANVNNYIIIATNNNPNQTATLIHENNGGNHQQNLAAEEDFIRATSEFETETISEYETKVKLERASMLESMKRAFEKGWRVTNIILTAFTREQSQMYSSQIDGSIYPHDTFVRALADPKPQEGIKTYGRAYGNGLANLGIIRRTINELVRYHDLAPGEYDLREFLGSRFLVGIHGGGSSSRNPKYTQPGKFNGVLPIERINRGDEQSLRPVTLQEELLIPAAVFSEIFPQDKPAYFNIYGDAILTFNPEELKDFINSNPDIAEGMTILLRRRDPSEAPNWGCAAVDEQGRIVSFSEKPTKGFTGSEDERKEILKKDGVLVDDKYILMNTAFAILGSATIIKWAYLAGLDITEEGKVKVVSQGQVGFTKDNVYERMLIYGGELDTFSHLVPPMAQKADPFKFIFSEAMVNIWRLASSQARFTALHPTNAAA